MIMASILYSPVPDSIEKLQADIERLQASQKMMRDANAALRKGDDKSLRAMGFSEEHIADLKERNFAGRAGFPNYALRNNNSSIRFLNKRMKELRGEPIGKSHTLKTCSKTEVGARIARDRRWVTTSVSEHKGNEW